eukprot:gene7687-7158_t
MTTPAKHPRERLAARPRGAAAELVAVMLAIHPMDSPWSSGIGDSSLGSCKAMAIHDQNGVPHRNGTVEARRAPPPAHGLASLELSGVSRGAPGSPPSDAYKPRRISMPGSPAVGLDALVADLYADMSRSLGRAVSNPRATRPADARSPLRCPGSHLQHAVTPEHPTVAANSATGSTTAAVGQGPPTPAAIGTCRTTSPAGGRVALTTVAMQPGAAHSSPIAPPVAMAMAPSNAVAAPVYGPALAPAVAHDMPPSASAAATAKAAAPPAAPESAASAHAAAMAVAAAATGNPAVPTPTTAAAPIPAPPGGQGAPAWLAPAPPPPQSTVVPAPDTD